MITEEIAKEEGINRLSAKLTVRPIKKPRVYKLCRGGQVDTGTINEATNGPALMMNPIAFFEGIETIFDPGENDPRKAHKVIENAVSFTTDIDKDGIARAKKKIEAVQFNNGLFVVWPQHYNTLVFMERSTNNKNNPFRDKSKPAVWEAVEEEKTNELLLAEEEIRIDAIHIAKELPSQEARAYAQKLTMPGLEKATPTDIKLFLIGKAKENPKEFINESGDIKAMYRLQISDAKAYGIIKFNADKSVWEQMAPEPKIPSGKKVATKKIVAVKPGDVPEDVLFEFFLEGGKQLPEYVAMWTALQNPEDYI